MSSFGCLHPCFRATRVGENSVGGEALRCVPLKDDCACHGKRYCETSGRCIGDVGSVPSPGCAALAAGAVADGTDKQIDDPLASFSCCDGVLGISVAGAVQPAKSLSHCAILCSGADWCSVFSWSNLSTQVCTLVPLPVGVMIDLQNGTLTQEVCRKSSSSGTFTRVNCSLVNTSTWSGDSMEAAVLRAVPQDGSCEFGDLRCIDATGFTACASQNAFAAISDIGGWSCVVEVDPNATITPAPTGRPPTQALGADEVLPMSEGWFGGGFSVGKMFVGFAISLTLAVILGACFRSCFRLCLKRYRLRQEQRLKQRTVQVGVRDTWAQPPTPTRGGAQRILVAAKSQDATSLASEQRVSVPGPPTSTTRQSFGDNNKNTNHNNTNSSSNNNNKNKNNDNSSSNNKAPEGFLPRQVPPMVQEWEAAAAPKGKAAATEVHMSDQFTSWNNRPERSSAAAARQVLHKYQVPPASKASRVAPAQSHNNNDNNNNNNNNNNYNNNNNDGGHRAAAKLGSDPTAVAAVTRPLPPAPSSAAVNGRPRLPLQ
ncbi:unnamed protein product [Polarella glacialis]|uniref:Uncharacterized protein n=1 Tax=Polarella glacialis TaxID=89957 RepID=A0A813E671_POLGL|nr:unnamed protein product [Polarella glacialis]